MGYKTEVLIHKNWAENPEQEKMLMVCLHDILHCGPTKHLDERNGPFDRGENYSGYRWQLDASNDWFAEFTLDTNKKPIIEGQNVRLTLSYRYGEEKLNAFAAWVKTRFEWV